MTHTHAHTYMLQTVSARKHGYRARDIGNPRLLSRLPSLIPRGIIANSSVRSRQGGLL